jgi:Rho GTPase-activating protein 1
VNLTDFHDANLAGHLIKKFLRDLPEPIIPELLYGLVESCPLDEDDSVL